MKFLNALYGLLQSALLFYRKLIKDLQKCGLKMNPYDLCVFNCTDNVKHLTVTFHVEDIKVSHMDPSDKTLFV